MPRATVHLIEWVCYMQYSPIGDSVANLEHIIALKLVSSPWVDLGTSHVVYQKETRVDHDLGSLIGRNGEAPEHLANESIEIRQHKRIPRAMRFLSEYLPTNTKIAARSQRHLRHHAGESLSQRLALSGDRTHVGLVTGRPPLCLHCGTALGQP